MRPVLMLVAVALLVPSATAGFGHEEGPDPDPVADDDHVTVYTTWPHLTAELERIAAEHPDVTRLHSAGQSTTGMDLWLVEIADFENPDRVPLEEREVLWIDGGTHANEYSAVMFVKHLLDFLVEGYGENETATWIVENRHTYVMPLLNPEGSLNGIGRLNDRGVNINRNYPTGWGDLAESPVLNNPGPYPASEPETRDVIDWWAEVQPDYMASIHCCGNLWLYPYGIEGRDPHPDDTPVYERVCDEAYYDVRDDCGPIWSTIYPASGSSVDTAYEMTGAVSFGFEMSGREARALWGPPYTTTPIEETERESWRGILHAFHHVHRYGGHPVVQVDAVSADAATFHVRNDGFGNLSGGTLAVVDADGVWRTVALPRLAVNDTATLRVPGTFTAGTFDVTLTYEKRPLAPPATRSLRLTVADGPDGFAAALQPAHEDAAPDLAPAGGAADAGRPIPGAALLLGLAGLAGGAAVRRRASRPKD